MATNQNISASSGGSDGRVRSIDHARTTPPPPSRPRRSNSSRSQTKVIKKIMGIMFLLLILVVMFVAIRGRHKEMMYVALVFTFFAIALFSYGYWSAVNRGDGIWQYIGPNNLQHQQMSNPNYHFNQINYQNVLKDHPRTKSYLVTLPKMGGLKLEIYTIGDDEQHQQQVSPFHHHPHNRHHNHNYHHAHHHQHHHWHNDLVRSKSSQDLRQIESNVKTTQLSGHDELDGDSNEPVKFEVQLPQKSSSQHFTEDFTEVLLPDCKLVTHSTAN